MTAGYIQIKHSLEDKKQKGQYYPAASYRSTSRMITVGAKSGPFHPESDFLEGRKASLIMSKMSHNHVAHQNVYLALDRC